MIVTSVRVFRFLVPFLFFKYNTHICCTLQLFKEQNDDVVTTKAELTDTF